MVMPKRPNIIYHLGSQGFIFASSRMVTGPTMRHSAVVLISLDGRAIDVGPANALNRMQAVLVPPRTQRVTRATDVAMLSINIHPVCPGFPCLARVEDIVPLDISAFSELQERMGLAHRGSLSIGEARKLFTQVVAILLGQLSRAHKPDQRAVILQQLLVQEPDITMGALAERMHMSYAGMSRLFAQIMGLPFRSYRLWQKSFNAFHRFPTDMNMTELAHAAGFTDAAHLSRDWRYWYGVPPGYMRNKQRVRILG